MTSASGFSWDGKEFKELTESDMQDELLQVTIGNEVYYKIPDSERMRPFFMSIVSDSNHWMFVSSNGGISAGRKNPEFSLFPYYTDDKIIDTAEITGTKTIFRMGQDSGRKVWEPFSIRGNGRYDITRNIYLNKLCNKVIFEEVNQTLELSFQYEWCSSDHYGFIKQSKLVNLSQKSIELEVVDGLQNILPFGLPADLQSAASNLADAYKRSELVESVGLGIFALSAIIVDKPEPSEALKANIVWQHGFQNPLHLLSWLQLQDFRNGRKLHPETDIKGEKGAYFVMNKIELDAFGEREWMFVANVNQNHADIINLAEAIKMDPHIHRKVMEDIHRGTRNLMVLTYGADALQSTSDGLKDARHYTNVLFNIMRGGVFDHNYSIDKKDFAHYLSKANKLVYKEISEQIGNLPEQFTLFELKEFAEETLNRDFIRLATEYLPLKFSRRHGDPSRPWNHFSINLKNESDGSKILDYEGNWRDIFQNWEALAFAYPGFIEGMIYKFLNASTFDGYNPYRVTKDGFDWETIEPDNPWSFIGYWGDHQIIYLLKFLEFAEKHQPGLLESLLDKPDFVFANVPYKIKSFAEIVKNPKETIDFDAEGEKAIHLRMKELGADGALLTDRKNEIYHVNFLEKILVTLLSKLSNFVPEGGIWMNTQRPEWNDANNALVGNGLSMVTLYYLRRFLVFFKPILQKANQHDVAISEELCHMFKTINDAFLEAGVHGNKTMDDSHRKSLTEALGVAGSEYRSVIQKQGFSGKKVHLSLSEISSFTENALNTLHRSMEVNKRKDGLYHAYNLLGISDSGFSVSHLYEILEGQVAVLSSGYLKAEESLHLLDVLKRSSLYRPDQNSYILYPNNKLPGFLQKNNIAENVVRKSRLFTRLLANGNKQVIEKDVLGGYHFNGNFRNAKDLEKALLSLDKEYEELVEVEKKQILQWFEDIFNHKEFTGRSGTFYGYEGLGSIYWHMVSKLLLAVQETCLRAIENQEDKELIAGLVEHYYDIAEGIGVHKSPELYGAFPIIPYSHTPMYKGAQQPGMTGQVKEDILCRIGELGVDMQNGKLVFIPAIMRKIEFQTESREIEYVDVYKKFQKIRLPEASMFFTWCQVPVIYSLGTVEGIEVLKKNGEVHQNDEPALSEADTQSVLKRAGEIQQIHVMLNESRFWK